MARKIPARRRCSSTVFESLEFRLLMSSTVRSVDGTGNNLANPTWGSAGTDLVRLTAAAYADGTNSPSLPADQSARTVSNLLNNQASSTDPSQDISTVDQNSASDYGYAFGQFIDHDLDLTPDGGASFPIAVASTDPIGPNALPFTRSQYDPATGLTANNPRQQVTTVTSYLDLSQVYGSSQTVSDALRTFSNGQLKTSPGNMLPYDNSTYFTSAQITALNMANDAQAVPESQLFAAGDRRANENVELTALETLFVRNHNAIAAQLKKDNPRWNDEQIYQEARKLNTAQYESIIYNEWIPAILGPSALPAYKGYQSSVNATIANEFSTVAFRFGHSMVSPEIERETNNGLGITNDPVSDSISLAQDFFDPNLLNPAGVIDPLTGQVSTDIGVILKADADGDGQAMDTMAISDIRNLLFGNGGFGGDDLMARDVQRGRDNGMADYNTMRVQLGLPAVTSFAQITSNVQVQQELAAAYPGGVNTIDAFEGGLAEDHVPGSDVGPLFQRIMANQFTRLRDGDRFFYLNENLTPAESKTLQQGNTLAKVIENNTNVSNLQPDVFLFRAAITGSVNSPANNNAPPHGLPNIVVNLQDTDGDILATTQTDPQGHYTFTQLSTPAANNTDTPGVSATGQYQIVLSLPTNLKQLNGNPPAVLISRGDMSVNGINFTVANTSPTPMPPPPAHMPPPPRPNMAPPRFSNGPMISQSQPNATSTLVSSPMPLRSNFKIL